MAKRKPGWQRVLDAFLEAPGRKLTNVQLGNIIGVQAWHQRITDLRKKGYQIDLHRLAQRDRTGADFVYTLVALPSSPRGPRETHQPPPAEPSPTYAPEALAEQVEIRCVECDDQIGQVPRRRLVGSEIADAEVVYGKCEPCAQRESEPSPV